jgi:ribonuclease HI
MIQIYTDGSCDLNNANLPNNGGIGIVILKDSQIIVKIAKQFKNTTNNKMELLAIVEGLIYCLNNGFKDEEIIVYSDSQYCIHGITDWIKTWRKNNYSKKGGLINAELWYVLDSLASSFNYLGFEWVKGHNGNIYNEMADRLAETDFKNLLSE